MQQSFVQTYYPLACQAGEAFRINPVVMLAQSAIESGWGQSTLAQEYRNFFGITAYGKPNVWWKGDSTELGPNSLKFRIYTNAQDSFMDYARLIRTAYRDAADQSYSPAAFARAISYSHYISEVNGDNREAYRSLLVRLSRRIEKRIAALQLDKNILHQPVKNESH